MFNALTFLCHTYLTTYLLSNNVLAFCSSFPTQDDDLTQQLLIYELKEWSNQTCLSLAVTANLKEFVAHPCVQVTTVFESV